MKIIGFFLVIIFLVEASQNFRKRKLENLQDLNNIEASSNSNSALTVCNQVSLAQYDGITLSGYLNVGISKSTSALGFIFHGAKGKKAAELKGIPTIFWLQGGPGEASIIGNFIQSGPLVINAKEDNTFEFIKQEYSWTENYNMIYVDQPIDVGVSVAENTSDIPISLEQVAEQFSYALNELFFNPNGCFYQYQLNTKETPIFIYGESFAGKYIPAISEKILLDGNKFNLVGVGLFNPKISCFSRLESFYQYAQDQELINEEKMKLLKQIVEEGKNAVAHQNWLEVGLSEQYIIDIFVSSGIDPGMIDGIELFPNLNVDFPKFLNSQQGKNLYKLDRKIFNTASDLVLEKIIFDGHKFDSIKRIENLLNSNIDVHVFAGDRDLIIPYNGNQIWVNQLNWKYLHEYQSQGFKVIRGINKNLLGVSSQYENFSLDIVFDGGHNLISYAPEGAKHFVEKAINYALLRKNKLQNQ